MIFLRGAFQGLSTWMSLGKVQLLHQVTYRAETLLWEVFFLPRYLCHGILPWTKFWLENFGGSDWRAYWQSVLVTVASCSQNWSSLCIWCLHHRWAARCKLLLRYSNANYPGKAALQLQRAFRVSVLCISPVRDKTIHTDVPVRAAAKWTWEQEQLDFSGVLNSRSRKPSLWTCSHTTDLWRGSSA